MMHRLVNIVSGRQVATRFHDKPRLLATAAAAVPEKKKKSKKKKGKKRGASFPRWFFKSRTEETADYEFFGSKRASRTLMLAAR